MNSWAFLWEMLGWIFVAVVAASGLCLVCLVVAKTVRGIRGKKSEVGFRGRGTS